VKHSIIPVLAAAGLALAACGQSADDKAQAQVCDARADIQKQVDQLRGLTITTATVDGVKSNLNAIKADLGKIKDAQGQLSDQRKQQVQAANKAFEDQVTTIVGSVGRSTSVTQAATQAKSAMNELADSYQQTLGRIDCS
jgi:Tfp pilus assembly protein PilP